MNNALTIDVEDKVGPSQPEARMPTQYLNSHACAKRLSVLQGGSVSKVSKSL